MARKSIEDPAEDYRRQCYMGRRLIHCAIRVSVLCFSSTAFCNFYNNCGMRHLISAIIIDKHPRTPPVKSILPEREIHDDIKNVGGSGEIRITTRDRADGKSCSRGADTAFID